MRRLICLILFSLFAATPLRADEVTVFAAASLKTALDAMAPGFEAATGHAVRFSFAGSSALARQILQGAPADVFVSANEAWMDVVADDGLIVPGSRADIAANRLALIAPTADGLTLDRLEDLPQVLGDGRLAMALVEAVPAGIYGKAALTDLGLWAEVAPQVVQADNVRAALALVALGEARMGVTYRTDALVEPRVTQLALFPQGSHAPIRYPAAQITDTPAAAAFVAYLRSPEGQKVLHDQGFAPADGP